MKPIGQGNESWILCEAFQMIASPWSNQSIGKNYYLITDDKIEKLDIQNMMALNDGGSQVINFKGEKPSLHIPHSHPNPMFYNPSFGPLRLGSVPLQILPKDESVETEILKKIDLIQHSIDRD